MRELRNWIDGELTGYTFTPDELRADREAIIRAAWAFGDVHHHVQPDDFDAIIAAAEEPTP